jgi:hypothetical protein
VLGRVPLAVQSFFKRDFRRPEDAVQPHPKQLAKFVPGNEDSRNVCHLVQGVEVWTHHLEEKLMQNRSDPTEV